MKVVEIATVITGFLPYILLIYGVVKGKVKQSCATWLLWLSLDVIVLTAIIVQKGTPVLYTVFAIGTFFTAISLLLHKQFSWGKFETTIALLVAICVIIFFLGGPYVATIATVAALNIGGIPQIVATYKEPKATPSSAYLLFAVSSIFSIFSTDLWTVQDKLPPLSSVFYCSLVFFLSLRKKSI